MTDTAKLMELIARSGLSESQLAAQLQIPQSSLHSKITGRTEFRASEMEKLSALLGLSLSDRETVFFSL